MFLIFYFIRYYHILTSHFQILSMLIFLKGLPMVLLYMCTEIHFILAMQFIGKQCYLYYLLKYVHYYPLCIPHTFLYSFAILQYDIVIILQDVPLLVVCIVFYKVFNSHLYLHVETTKTQISSLVQNQAKNIRINCSLEKTIFNIISGNPQLGFKV